MFLASDLCTALPSPQGRIEACLWTLSLASQQQSVPKTTWKERETPVSQVVN